LQITCWSLAASKQHGRRGRDHQGLLTQLRTPRLPALAEQQPRAHDRLPREVATMATRPHLVDVFSKTALVFQSSGQRLWPETAANSRRFRIHHGPIAELRQAHSLQKHERARGSIATDRQTQPIVDQQATGRSQDRFTGEQLGPEKRQHGAGEGVSRSKARILPRRKLQGAPLRSEEKQVLRTQQEPLRARRARSRSRAW